MTDPATVRFGPGPPLSSRTRPGPPTDGGRRRGPVVIMAAAAVLVVVTGVGLATLAGAGDETAACDPPQVGVEPVAPPGAHGCALVWWDRTRGVAHVLEGANAGIYAIGEPGHQLLVADWDCDGTPSPAVVAPTTGEVFTFEQWPPDDAVLVGDRAHSLGPGETGQIGRDAVIGCDAIVPEGQSPQP